MARVRISRPKSKKLTSIKTKEPGLYKKCFYEVSQKWNGRFRGKPDWFNRWWNSYQHKCHLQDGWFKYEIFVLDNTYRGLTPTHVMRDNTTCDEDQAEDVEFLDTDVVRTTGKGKMEGEEKDGWLEWREDYVDEKGQEERMPNIRERLARLHGLEE